LASVNDVMAFRRACYEAARRTGGELTELRIGDEPTPNFHQILSTARRAHQLPGCFRLDATQGSVLSTSGHAVCLERDRHVQ
jgi:hypothetical protein